jgi:hypothetical protein
VLVKFIPFRHIRNKLGLTLKTLNHWASRKEYASKALLSDEQIISLIEDGLYNPAFNADDVDTDMLKSFASRRRSSETGVI